MFEREVLYKSPAERISANGDQSSSFSLKKFGWNNTSGKRKRRMSKGAKSLPVFPGPPRRLQRLTKIVLVHVGKLNLLPPTLDPPLCSARRTLANCDGNKHTTQ